MKKFAKMSLVAAIAVAGLTSTATAGSLEEAIKGVNISGFVEYRAEKVLKTKTDVTDEAHHDIDIRLQAVVPVNDQVNAVIRFDETADEDSDGGTLDSNAIAFDIDRAYFAYNNDGLTVNFGLQGAPLTDGGSGDGVTVSKAFGDVSLSAGYLFTTSATNADDVWFLSASGTAGMVSYYATYAMVDDSDAADTFGSAADGEADTFHAGLSAKFEMVNVAVDYSTLDADAGQRQSQTKLSLSTTLGAVNLGVQYAVNGNDGGETMVDGSDASASEISIGALELTQEGDASAFLLSASVAVGEKGTAKIRYADLDGTAARGDLQVIRANYDYQMSSNFKAYLEYTINDRDGSTKASDYVVGAKYSF